MRWETIRKRVQQKIDETGANMAALSRELGHSDGFMHAFLVTKKQKSLKMQDIEKLSALFKVSDNWLLGLDGAEKTAFKASEKSLLEKSGISFSDVVSVSDIEKHRVLFAGLDIVTGACSIIELPISQTHKGFIVDPILFQKNNVYLNAFASRSSMMIWLKKVKLSTQEEFWFILNSDKG